MSGDRQPGAQGLTRLQIGLLLVAIAGAALAIVLGSGDAEGGQRVFLFSHTAGDVVFDHTGHVMRPDACITCHHDLWNTSARDCSACHGDRYQKRQFPHATVVQLHSTGCVTCHVDETDDREPQSCRACHPPHQADEVATLGCDKCHGFSRPSGMNHELLISAHGTDGCQTCHRTRSVSAAYHESCTGCHVERDPERFLDPDEAVLCGWCHLQ